MKRLWLGISLLLISHTAISQTIAKTAAIRVDADTVENHVSPRMYAAFMEMMAEDVKRGLTAEMLLDRSFEEPVNYLGLPAHWQIEPDERNDLGDEIRFTQTTEEALPKTDLSKNTSNHSLLVTLGRGDYTGTRRGLSQGRLSIRAGQTYKGYLWARVPEKNGYVGEVKVALEEDDTDGRSYAEATLSGLAGDWRKYQFSLTPSETDRFSKLSLLFSGHGRLYLDEVSLEPADSQDQVRADTAAKIRELHPSFLRWPGGNVAQDYHWQWGIGERDRRPVWINKSWSNAPEPNDLGTDEYLALCRRLNIEPSITVNVGGAGATAEEAAAWVEYVSGPASSKYGGMRAANGHPGPYGVKQWELGNEIFGDWVRGHVSAEDYAHEAVRYAKAMRAVDPSIQLTAVGESDAWNEPVLRIAGPEIQYLAIHSYATVEQGAKAANPRNGMMAQAGEFERRYAHIGDMIRQLVPGHPIKIIVNEWNLFYGADVIQSMEGAVYASRLMNGFERDGDVVDSNSISDILNGWTGGILQVSRDRIYGTPQFYALKMYNDHLGTDRLHADVSSPELEPKENAVDAVATRSADGNQLYVKMSNANRTEAIQTSVEIKGFVYGSNVEVDLLAKTGPLTHNTFEDPDAILPSHRTIQCKQTCPVELPPDSIAVLSFRRTE